MFSTISNNSNNYGNIESNRMESSDAPQEASDGSDGNLLETSDVLSATYLCLSLSNGRCGSSLYHSFDHSVQVVQEVDDNGFDSIVALLLQTEPNHVILSSKSDPKLIEFLVNFSNNLENESNSDLTTNTKSIQDSTHLLTKSNSIETNSTEETPNTTRSPKMVGIRAQIREKDLNRDLLWKMETKFKVHVISHTLFAFESSKTRILSIDLDNDLNLSNETQKFLYISSLIEFSNNNTFRSFGALLRFLDTNCIEIQMQTNRSTVCISGISRLYLQQLVSIERNTYESLQIFQQEWHPCAAKQGYDQKEGLSLYGLFNCCVSKIGSNYLRKLFLRPTQDMDVIKDRLTAIEFFVDPNNFVLRDSLNQHLKHIKNVIPLFTRIMTFSFSLIDLKNIYNNLINGMRIRDIIVRQNACLKIFDQIRHSFSEELDQLAHVINNVVDFDKSSRSQSFEINFGIDPELDNAKYVFSHLSLMLEEVAQQEVITFESVLTDCNCAYVPQIGFLTSARLPEGQTPIAGLEENLQFVVRAGDRVYYKTMRTKELDEEFGDIQSEINDRQIEIISRLQELLNRKKYLFVSLMKCCATLDALLAMAQTAVNFRYTKPNLTSDGVIDIVDGRHPLIELISKTFVPNDYHSGGQYKKVKIISGPNACGKSVYLKQICLIVYMAHIGSFVPALRADITVIDRIFTRIHTPESLTLRLSTFMLDLNQMSNATKNARNNSLVVVDEFGKGTQPVDGLALMAASVDHWLSGDTPFLIVSTHFHSLVSILNRRHSYDCQTFLFERDEKQLNYLFKLIDGHFKQSIASHIAYLAGISVPIIERGLQICDSMSLNEAIPRLESPQLDQKYHKYEQIAQKLLELNIDSDEQSEQFIQFLIKSFQTQPSDE